MKRLKAKKKVDLFLPETVNNQNDYGFKVTFKDDGYLIVTEEFSDMGMIQKNLSTDINFRKKNIKKTRLED